MNFKMPEENIEYCFKTYVKEIKQSFTYHYLFSHIDNKGYCVFINTKNGCLKSMTLARFNFLLKYNLVDKTILKENEKPKQEEKTNQTTEKNMQTKKTYTEQEKQEHKKLLTQIIATLSSYLNKKEQIKLQLNIDIENLIKDFKSYLNIPLNSEIDPKFGQIMTDYIKIDTKYKKAG